MAGPHSLRRRATGFPGRDGRIGGMSEAASSEAATAPAASPRQAPSDAAPPESAHPYDALLLLSFGGPEGPDDVVPFLENVTRGRGIPRERLKEVGRHYFLFGGRSPINDQNREFLAALREDLSGNGIDLPAYWGNRNWDPYLEDPL